VFAPAVRRADVRLVNAVHGDLSVPSRIDRRAAATPPDLVIANSRFTAGPAAKLFPGARVEVVYLPVPAPVDVNREAARRDVRAEFGTPADAVVVLQASRLEAWKGQAVHLQALAELLDVPGWEAWFAGGSQKPGEARFLAELRCLADRLGLADRVRFLGHRADVTRVMAAADVYCQPNTGPEPFGLAFVEALNAGLPVVTSRFGGAAEVVDETCGVLTSPGDAAGVAVTLARLIRDPARRAELASAGPGRARELSDPATHMSRSAALLRSRG
jgi:glycosyltransferase involved in cell wall biosynthesis